MARKQHKYLLHLTREGYPVGIHSLTESFYLPSDKTHETYGKAVVHSRGSDTPWDEWCDQLSDQALGLRARWSVIKDTSEDMEDLLLRLQRSAQYEM